jgi:phytol kinase
MIHPVIAILAVLTILISLLLGLKQIQKHLPVHPEVLRKILHVVMGCVSLTFPWVFAQPEPVIILALTAAASLFVIKRHKRTRETIGTAFCSVKRESFGELCFPLSVAILFTVSHTQPLFYVIPIVILTVSDALSALIGIFAGRLFFTTKEGHKTVEGSLTFLASAAIATFAILVFYAHMDATVATLVSLIIGSLVTLFEAMSWRGLDNLFIPLSAYAFLKTHISLDIETLVGLLVLAVALVAFAVVWRRRTTLDDSAALGAALLCYISLTVGGLAWVLPPITVFAGYRWLMPKSYRDMPRVHSILTVLSVGVVGFVWLAVFKTTGRSELLFPYTLCYAMHMVAIAVAHIKSRLSGSRVRLISNVVCKTWVLFFVPYVACTGMTSFAAGSALLGLVILGAGTAMFYLLQCRDSQALSSQSRWTKQIVVAGACSSLALFVLSFVPMF